MGFWLLIWEKTELTEEPKRGQFHVKGEASINHLGSMVERWPSSLECKVNENEVESDVCVFGNSAEGKAE